MISGEIRSQLARSWKRVTHLDESVFLQLKHGRNLKTFYIQEHLDFAQRFVGTQKRSLNIHAERDGDVPVYYESSFDALCVLFDVMDFMCKEIDPYAILDPSEVYDDSLFDIDFDFHWAD